MNGYLLSIIGTVLICSVLTAVLPSGKTAGVIKGIAKLACVIAIIAPIPQFLGAWGDFDTNSEKNAQQTHENFSQSVIQTDESFIKYYCEMRVRHTEETLNAELAEKFSVQATTDIDWRFQEESFVDSNEIVITKISVKLQEEKTLEEKNAVRDYLTKNYCSEVQIE